MSLEGVHSLVTVPEALPEDAYKRLAAYADSCNLSVHDVVEGILQDALDYEDRRHRRAGRIPNVPCESPTRVHAGERCPRPFRYRGAIRCGCPRTSEPPQGDSTG